MVTMNIEENKIKTSLIQTTATGKRESPTRWTDLIKAIPQTSLVQSSRDAEDHNKWRSIEGCFSR